MAKACDRRLIGAIDIAIIILIVVISVLSLVLQFSSSTTITAVVRVKGQVVHTVVLNSVDEPFDVTFNGDLPVTVKFSQDGVSVVNSDCPDKLCVHSGKVSSVGQSVVCLPAKVTVTLVSDNWDFADAVVG